MAQRVFWNWEDDDLTRDLARSMNGYLPSGLYRGFDFGVQDSMTLKLVHTVTGFDEANANQDGLTNKKGLWRTVLGATVTEDTEVTIPITDADPTHPRIDLIIGSHTYVQSPGGQPAFYAVVAGTPAASPVAPAVPNPITDVIIGLLYVPAGITDLSDPGVIWTKSDFPHLGGKPDDFNNDNDYSSNFYVADGDTRKVAIGKLDAALKALSDATNAAITDIFNKMTVVVNPTGNTSILVTERSVPVVPGRKEFEVSVNVVDLGDNPNLLQILPTGFYRGRGIDSAEVFNHSGVKDAIVSGLVPFILEVKTFSIGNIQYTYQTYRPYLSSTLTISHEPYEFKRHFLKDGANPIPNNANLNTFRASGGNFGNIYMQEVIAIGSLASGGSFNGNWTIANDNWDYYGNTIPNVQIQRSRSSGVAWSTKLGGTNSQELKWNLPVDGIKRRWRIEFQILFYFDADGSANEVSWGISGPLASDINDLFLGFPYQLHALQTYYVSDAGTHVWLSHAIHNTTSLGTASESFRAHIRQMNVNNVNIRGVRANVIGIPF